MARGTNTQISPVVAAITLVVIIILAVVGGIWFMNKPKADPIAEAAMRDRASAASSAVGARPAPMGGQPPKAGATDYAPAGPMPPRLGSR